MRILVLGGTVFVGRHFVQEALARGHRVTLFNRGRSAPPGLFPEAETVLGDRDGGLAALGERTFDAVLDTSGYFPRVVAQSAQRFASTGLYVFVSTISAYKDIKKPGLDEDGELIELPDPTIEKMEGEAYGGLKVLCEREVQRALPGRALILRPGLIVGPDDPTDRFTYWVRRLASGETVLAPAPGDEPVQWIDVRDLARFTLDLVERGMAGVFNVVGPEAPLSFRSFLEEAKRALGSSSKIAPVSWTKLEEAGVRPWMDLPLFVPESGLSLSQRKAKAAGLRVRPLSDTVLATRAYDEARGLPALKAGLSSERERELLQAAAP